MIRRETPSQDGQARWVLIMQPDHARLAGRCAEVWGAPPYARLQPHAELVAAINRHDDGWAEWESKLQVDPESGWPRQFTEMPVAQSLAIWRRSIESAATVGYLAGYVVSGHFCVLLERFAARWQQGSQEEQSLARSFLDEQAELRSTWLSRWCAQDPKQNQEGVAQTALGWLQFFDALSLWFCCHERTAAETFRPPIGPPLTVTPLTKQEFKVSPWPFSIPYLETEMPGRQMPVAKYRSREQLAEALWKPVALTWRLLPG